MGRNSSEPEFQKAVKELPYTIIKYLDQPRVLVSVKNDYAAYLPEVFIGMILKKLRAWRRGVNAGVEWTVIAVLYESSDQQRNATLQAAKLARLNVLRLPDEPKGCWVCVSNRHNVLRWRNNPSLAQARVRSSRYHIRRAETFVLGLAASNGCIPWI